MRQLPPLNIWFKIWCIFLTAAAFWLGSYAYWQHRYFEAIYLTVIGVGAWAFWKRKLMGRYIMMAILGFGILISLFSLVAFRNILYMIQLPIATFILYKVYKFKPQETLV